MHRKQILCVHILQSGQFGRKKKQKNSKKKGSPSFWLFMAWISTFVLIIYISPHISLPNLCEHKSKNNNFSFSFLFSLQVKQRITSSFFSPHFQTYKRKCFLLFLLSYFSFHLLFLFRFSSLNCNQRKWSLIWHNIYCSWNQETSVYLSCHK